MIRIKSTALILMQALGWLFLNACNAPNVNVRSGDDTAKAAGQWQNLSDSKNISWHTYGKSVLGKAWKIEDSTIHLDASVKDGWQTKDGGDIVTNDEYENFDLRLQWKISEAGNSGIMFYVKEDTSKYKFPWESGPEMQVADNEKNEDGKVLKSRAGDLYELMSISKEVIKPAGEWNDVEIVVNNGKLDFHINGEHVLSTTMWDDAWKKNLEGTKFRTMPGFGTFRKGRIGLQDHGADVWFRNVKVMRL